MLFVFIGMSTLFGVCGQLALKVGMGRIAQITDQQGGLLSKIIVSPWVMGGLFTYGTGVIFWLLALSRDDVSYVYPFASLSYIGIMIGSYFLFKERITSLRLVGVACIILGVIITGINI